MSIKQSLISFLLEHSQMSRFEKMVLYQTSRIRMGQTMTYGELAAKTGSPRSARAVGNALHRNPYPILIPCHRVVASNGIGGYGKGVLVKKLLLWIESVRAA